MQTNNPLLSRLMTARIHKAMNARITRTADEGTTEASRRLDRKLEQMSGGWVAESNVGAVLGLLLDDCERANSSTPGAVVSSASATMTPPMKVIKVYADGLTPASSLAAPPASAGQGQQEASQPEVEGVLPGTRARAGLSCRVQSRRHSPMTLPSSAKRTS